MACTVVITDTGPSKSFNVNIGLHQRSVLSPLMFDVFMDIGVVSRVVVCGVISSYGTNDGRTWGMCSRMERYPSW